ncbi:MAG: hypothetical protein WAZ77_07405 [Candidatus Nitrosopolaris sp.]
MRVNSNQKRDKKLLSEWGKNSFPLSVHTLEAKNTVLWQIDDTLYRKTNSRYEKNNAEKSQLSLREIF